MVTSYLADSTYHIEIVLLFKVFSYSIPINLVFSTIIHHIDDLYMLAPLWFNLITKDLLVPTVTTMSHYFTVKRILFDIISDLAVGYRNCNVLANC